LVEKPVKSPEKPEKSLKSSKLTQINPFEGLKMPLKPELEKNFKALLSLCMKLGWDIAISKDNERVQGIIMGDTSYVNNAVDKLEGEYAHGTWNKAEPSH